MKTLLLIPLAVAAVLAAAAGLCALLGLPMHGHDLVTAAVVAIVAAELALLPAWAVRRREQATFAQLALGGTVLQMMLTVLLATAVSIARVVEPQGPFVFWLTGAYWLSLAMLVWALLSMMPPEGGRPKETAPKQTGFR
jgi:hypothetical protein